MIEEQKNKAIIVVHPVDWAINFVWSKKFILAYLALPCFFVDFIVSYLGLSFPLSTKQTILITALSSLPTAWLIGVIVLYFIEHCKGNPFEICSVALRALAFLPKVFFSYISVLWFVIYVTINPLSLFLLLPLFFLWAPAFAACDIYAPLKTNPSEEEIDFDEEEFIIPPRKESFLFSAPWNIGWSRSINLAMRDFFPTLTICLLFWVLVTAPSALAYLIATDSTSVFFLLIQNILASITSAWALGLWAATFIMLLPEQARNELNIAPAITFWRDLSEVKYFKFYGQFYPIIIALFIGIASTSFLLYQTKLAKDMPSTVRLTVTNSYLENDKLVVRFNLEDNENKFRWFVPTQFVVGLGEQSPNQDDTHTPFGLWSNQTISTIAPESESLVIYDSGGRELTTDIVAPRDGPIEIVARYNLANVEEAKKGFSLYYKNILTPALNGPLYKGVPR